MTSAQPLTQIFVIAAREIVRNRNGQHYLVSTADTPDHGRETMAFECDERGHVTSWSEVAFCRHAPDSHARVLAQLSQTAASLPGA